MATYVHRLATAASRIEHPLLHIASRFASSFKAGLRTLQYAQMVTVLNRMPDEHLKEAGVRRSDIPAYARRLVGGED